MSPQTESLIFLAWFKFFSSLNFALLPITKARGTGKEIKPLLSVVLSLKALF